MQSTQTSRRRWLPAAWLGVLFLLATPSLTSCHAMSYRVGAGGNGVGQVTMHQYYLFFGMIPMNDVDIQGVVADYTSYDIESGFFYHDDILTGLGDIVISALLFPLTVTRRAVTVKY